MGAVKRASKQAEKARETRRRIVAAARDCFLEQGYGATTLQDVAAAAGVAVQTIYFTFGTKRALLKEVVDTAIAGDDAPVPTLQRPWLRDALAADTAGELLRRFVAGTGAVLARVALVYEATRAAAAVDPEVATLWPTGPDPRYTVELAVARALVRKPGARPRLRAADAADVLYTVLSPEVYLLTVRDRGWSRRRWQAWALETLRPQLCGEPLRVGEAGQRARGGGR